MPERASGVASVVALRGAFLVCLASGEDEVLFRMKKKVAAASKTLIESVEGFCCDALPTVEVTVFWDTVVAGAPAVTVRAEIRDLESRSWALTAAVQNVMLTALQTAFCSYLQTACPEWAEAAAGDLFWCDRPVNVNSCSRLV